MFVFTAPSTSYSPIFPPLLGPPYALKCNDIEFRPISKATVASKSSNERKDDILLMLSQKLERIKLSEEGMSNPRQAES